jgi:hypothetical protein
MRIIHGVALELESVAFAITFAIKRKRAEEIKEYSNIVISKPRLRNDGFSQRDEQDE